MSVFLAFVALDQLKLGSIFLRVESLVVNVESMFDALVGRFWVGEKYHKGEILGVVLVLSSQRLQSHYLNSISFVLIF